MKRRKSESSSAQTEVPPLAPMSVSFDMEPLSRRDYRILEDLALAQAGLDGTLMRLIWGVRAWLRKLYAGTPGSAEDRRESP